MALTKVKGSSFIDGTITDTQFANTTITTGDMAVDPRNADNYTTGSVPLAQLGNVPAADTTGLDNDIALLGFKTAANGSLAKYDLVDQTVDAFEDASGVDSGSSTNATRNASKYYSGSADTQTAFTSTGNTTWTSPAGVTSATVLVVGGGGGASRAGWTPGGAGAGGLVYVAAYTTIANQLYNLTIGTGGAGSTSNGTAGTNGADSVFDVSGTSQILTAVGGGYGGMSSPNSVGSGGSGGGGSQAGTTGTSNQPASFGAYSNVGFGNDGGTGNSGGTNRPTGGGGGAGSVGQNYQGTSASGNGGAGKDYSSVFGTTVGDDGWFAGGGGGGGTAGATAGIGNGGSGLKGGGGSGGTTYGQDDATAGLPNTGGGGGANTNDMNGKAGGSGVIIIKYSTYENMTLVSNLTAAQAAPTKGDIVFTYTNGAGTAVINTNITAEVSADNGSTWTLFSGLTSQGTTGGHIIVSAHDQTITSTITSPYNMRYRIKTLVQSASMQTRIQAVSLGWS